MSYVFCNSCGHRNPPQSGFCSACGSVLDQPEERTIVLAKVDPLQDAPGDADNVSLSSAELHSGKGLLVVRSGAQSGNRYVVDGLTTIGRHPESTICLDDVTVSRRHAQVVLDNGRYVVRDLGSLNGTYVNQMRIDELVLEQGDELQIGKYRMVFFNG
jgi:hypothetical protein